MEITNQRISLLRLWVESFSVINRCTGKLIGAVLCSVLLLGLVIGIILVGFGTSALFAHLQMAILAKSLGIATLVVYILFILLSNFYGIFFMTVCWQIIGAEALGQKRPLSEFFSGSIFPTLSQIAAAFILLVPYIVVLIVLAFLIRYPLLMILVMFAIGLLAVRLCYSFLSMALANKGPIEGLQLSWQMTAGNHYVDSLLMCVMTVGSFLLVEAVLVAIGYALYINIPLHFAQSFSLAHLSLVWYVAGFVLTLILVFAFFSLMAFPVLVFLNRHAQFAPTNTKPTEENIFIPLPELEIPSSTLKTASQSTSQEVHPVEDAQQGAFQPQERALPPAPPATDHLQNLDELQITHASVHTDTTDVHDISEHLDKVYTPKPEDLVQYGDEDRMPTILFDEDMEKQLKESAPKPTDTKPNNPPEDGPVKMSK